MAEGKLETFDFDKYLSLSEKTERASAVAANDAFIRAMANAVKRGREKAKSGTYIDHSPAIYARRIRADMILSACGSPAALCMESGGSHIGAEAMK